jgi:hypothetical protein
MSVLRISPVERLKIIALIFSSYLVKSGIKVYEKDAGFQS